MNPQLGRRMLNHCATTLFIKNRGAKILVQQLPQNLITLFPGALMKSENVTPLPSRRAKHQHVTAATAHYQKDGRHDALGANFSEEGGGGWKGETLEFPRLPIH